jgi:hypothetical protein
VPTANVENHVAGRGACRLDGGLGQLAPTRVKVITEQKPSGRVLPRRAAGLFDL